MGLIKAAAGAAGGALADTWKDFFYCEALDKNTLVVKGQKQSGRRSSNTKGNDNIITTGSGIVVSDGQCMIIVDQGVVVEICAEPGQYTYDASTEPSIFAGNLGQDIAATFRTMGRRITYGGDTAHDQRVYYFNIKELIDNKFGTPNPVPFRIVDKNVGLDLDVSVRCSGLYSYKIANPILFYTNVCGNVSNRYLRSEIQDQLKTEFISALQPAFAELSEMEIRPNQIIAHNAELEAAMNDALSQKWSELRGLEIVSIAIGSITLPEDDQELIKSTQRAGALRDPGLAAGTLVGAQAEAMQAAAANEGGAMGGFVGMGMAMNAGGANTTNLYGMAQQNQEARQNGESEKITLSAWTCTKCGTQNMGNFCTECGEKKPAGPVYCKECGAEVPADSNFCPQCGKKLK